MTEDERLTILSRYHSNRDTSGITEEKRKYIRNQTTIKTCARFYLRAVFTGVSVNGTREITYNQATVDSLLWGRP